MVAPEQLEIPITIAISPSNQNSNKEPVDTQERTDTTMSSKLFNILTGFHAGYFRISLSLCSQAFLWKTLSEPVIDAALLRPFLRLLPSAAFYLIWSLALFSVITLCFLYALRCSFKFQYVKAEFNHHVGMNYLFAPWISLLFLLQSAPFLHHKSTAYFVLWIVFSIPIVILDIKIYGQWFTQGKKLLSLVANPTSLITVIGNLIGARAAARMGWEETATCMFSLGMTHYLVLFVTLYQRFTESSSLPAMLRPVFFHFIAAPSMASLAWSSISGSYDITAKMLFFISFFLFISLGSRPALFKRSMMQFSIGWWSYPLPITLLALAATEYAQEMKNEVSNALMLLLAVLSVLVTIVLLIVSAFKTSHLLPIDDDPFMPSL